MPTCEDVHVVDMRLLYGAQPVHILSLVSSYLDRSLISCVIKLHLGCVIVVTIHLVLYIDCSVSICLFYISFMLSKQFTSLNTFDVI